MDIDGNPMLFQTGRHRAADAGEVILDDLRLGGREVVDMLVERRRRLAWNQQGSSSLRRCSMCRNAESRAFLCSGVSIVSPRPKKPLGTFPRASVSHCAPTQGKSLPGDIYSPNTAALPSSASISISRLYLAIRSLRQAEPVLIWPPPIATAKSAMKASSVSPERCEIT